MGKRVSNLPDCSDTQLIGIGRRIGHHTGCVMFQRLCAQLRAGGALTTDVASARVLKAFADCGLFHLGGVLVGTHAFTVLGNMLGVRWEQAFLRTQDIDSAGSVKLDMAVPELKSDIPKCWRAFKWGSCPFPRSIPSVHSPHLRCGDIRCA